MEDAQKNFGIEEFVALPMDLQKIWSDIPADIETLSPLLQPIKEFLQTNAQKGDVVLVQGDFGAVYIMVDFAKHLELMPVYATTKRIAQEYINDAGQSVKKSLFEHRRFREYE